MSSEPLSAVNVKTAIVVPALLERDVEPVQRAVRRVDSERERARLTDDGWFQDIDDRTRRTAGRYPSDATAESGSDDDYDVSTFHMRAIVPIVSSAP